MDVEQRGQRYGARAKDAMTPEVHFQQAWQSFLLGHPLRVIQHYKQNKKEKAALHLKSTAAATATTRIHMLDSFTRTAMIT